MKNTLPMPRLCQWYVPNRYFFSGLQPSVWVLISVHTDSHCDTNCLIVLPRNYALRPFFHRMISTYSFASSIITELLIAVCELCTLSISHFPLRTTYGEKRCRWITVRRPDECTRSRRRRAS